FVRTSSMEELIEIHGTISPRYGKRMASMLAHRNHPDVEGAGGQIYRTILHSQPVPEKQI
ncbi:hypothetical protein A2U01_0084870, partial [Trifolium medium]|nr:hypothetical protein [Trifolium medium]